MLQSIIEYLKEAGVAPFVVLFIYWAIWPGMMFIVGIILESRLVPIGYGQSRMFMPGDFMLGLGTIVLLLMSVENGVCLEETWGTGWWTFTGIGTAVFAVIRRYFDARNYPKRAAWSPTKLTHDFFGYFLCTWILIALGVPQVIHCFQEEGAFSECIVSWMTFFMATACYILMGVRDHINPPIAAIMHPDDYKPIWAHRTNK